MSKTNVIGVNLLTLLLFFPISAAAQNRSGERDKAVDLQAQKDLFDKIEALKNDLEKEKRNDDSEQFNSKIRKSMTEVLRGNRRMDQQFDKSTSEIRDIFNQARRAKQRAKIEAQRNYPPPNLPPAQSQPLVQTPSTTLPTPTDRTNQAEPSPQDLEVINSNVIPNPVRFNPDETIPIENLQGSPVDKLRLANNVFAVGDMQLAGEYYREILKDNPKGWQERWAKFQLAACHRRVGSYKEALNLLKDLAQSRSNEFPIPEARWWIKEIENREVIENDMKIIDNVIKKASEKYDKYTNR